MYYYIFDPPQGTKEYERTAQIKELLSNLGIAGEMTSPVPGKSIEDLVHAAINKRYSTVVAVGGMELINRVAMALVPHEAVFGIIPSSEHPDIARLIGVHDWKSAAEQLKLRRHQPIRLGTINKTGCFLTPASITVPPGSRFQITTPKFTVQSDEGTITLTPLGTADEGEGLEIDITPEAVKPGFFSKLLGKSKEIPNASRFQVEWAEIQTEDELSVKVAGTVLTTTPLSCRLQAKPLKLIVARGGAHS